MFCSLPNIKFSYQAFLVEIMFVHSPEQALCLDEQATVWWFTILDGGRFPDISQTLMNALNPLNHYHSFLTKSRHCLMLPQEDDDWPSVWLWLRLRWRHPQPASHITHTGPQGLRPGGSQDLESKKSAASTNINSFGGITFQKRGRKI